MQIKLLPRKSLLHLIDLDLDCWVGLGPELRPARSPLHRGNINLQASPRTFTSTLHPTILLTFQLPIQEAAISKLVFLFTLHNSIGLFTLLTFFTAQTHLPPSLVDLLGRPRGRTRTQKLSKLPILSKLLLQPQTRINSRYTK